MRRRHPSAGRAAAPGRDQQAGDAVRPLDRTVGWRSSRLYAAGGEKKKKKKFKIFEEQENFALLSPHARYGTLFYRRSKNTVVKKYWQK
eukprot:SAG31_NODE_6840_length_1873_cov_1.472943_1_plen_89_part_00